MCRHRSSSLTYLNMGIFLRNATEMEMNLVEGVHIFKGVWISQHLYLDLMGARYPLGKFFLLEIADPSDLSASKTNCLWVFLKGFVLSKQKARAPLMSRMCSSASWLSRCDLGWKTGRWIGWLIWNSEETLGKNLGWSCSVILSLKKYCKRGHVIRAPISPTCHVNVMDIRNAFFTDEQSSEQVAISSNSSLLKHLWNRMRSQSGAGLVDRDFQVPWGISLMFGGKNDGGGGRNEKLWWLPGRFLWGSSIVLTFSESGCSPVYLAAMRSHQQTNLVHFWESV